MKNIFLLLIGIAMTILLTGCPGDNDDEQLLKLTVIDAENKTGVVTISVRQF
ncbi:hypothetical protein M2451_001255 [Dysgonomonas sp. PFB1-18]|uniref:hypothetical protein n=1 Tax=unclassified Dysgonomonas TaxID=2630389 RepID=UPI0024732C90|nr:MULTISPECIES: hypothetical protein [unclassified Dysgonomonas]MDH6308689.1 hypothetical protein [Dysgonomonas sp. PF1-14]MDH6338614.1 hypothetical protein [Dysgonomonas sp. PF1-16]MDH6379938.1 hypothetical protein [Dysgonomonas sp. PFB1-18]MDH6397442.1 hypothetical protein [Dysgonomonas sp. PF1-23]